MCLFCFGNNHLVCAVHGAYMDCCAIALAGKCYRSQLISAPGTAHVSANEIAVIWGVQCTPWFHLWGNAMLSTIIPVFGYIQNTEYYVASDGRSMVLATSEFNNDPNTDFLLISSYAVLHDVWPKHSLLSVFIKCKPLFYCIAMQRFWSFVHSWSRGLQVISRWNTHKPNSLEKSFRFLISTTVQISAAVHRSKPNLTVASLSAMIFILAMNPSCALYSSDQSLIYSCFALCNPSRLHTLNWSSPWEAGSLMQHSQHGTHQQHTSGVWFPYYSQYWCKYHSCCWSVWLIGPPSAACDLTSSILSLHVLIRSIDSIIDFVLSRTVHYCFHPSMA